MLLALIAVGLAASSAAAQAPGWREIGKTSTGNAVYVDPASISKDAAGIITATVRVVYAEPVDTPQGPITGSRAVAMFDCAAKKVAVKESIIWHDERRGTIYRQSRPAKPGFGPALTSTFAHVAMEHLCAAG
ncbi:MAG: hypothetical protein KF709_05070 [Gemmatimonadaceae bacterium]|nr:hypothetical protein [Gemmatimonadaceae bacterium]